MHVPPYITHLTTLAQSGDTQLIQAVASIILNQTEGDPEQGEAFFRDLFAYGCQSGMVTPLISYAQTHQFFDEHYDDIETLREEYEVSRGVPLTISGDLKNTLSWFAFEETARYIASEIECSV